MQGDSSQKRSNEKRAIKKLCKKVATTRLNTMNEAKEKQYDC
jgi:hypothetical protein